MDRGDELVIPVVGEEIDASTRQVTTGGVRVTKRVVGHEEVLEQNLVKEHVEVRRVQVGKQVDGPLPQRHEGTTLIVPIVEEVLRVEKIWMLKEELHITTTKEAVPHRETVVLHQEQATIERLDEEGDAIRELNPKIEPAHPSSPVRTAKPPVSTGSILERHEPERAERTKLGQSSIIKRS